MIQTRWLILGFALITTLVLLFHTASGAPLGQTVPPAAETPTGDPAEETIAADRTTAATVDTGNGRLRVRWGPGVQYPIMTWLQNGASTSVLAQNQSGDWMLIIGPNGLYGWVASAYLRLDGDQAAVPVIGVGRAATVQAPTAGSTERPTAPPVPTPFSQAGSAPTGATQPARPSSPEAAPRGLLALPIFDTERKTYDVWTVNADGSNWQKVVSEASAPALSQDGRLLAYRRWQVEDRGIVVADRTGANPLRITDHLEDVLPSFSPDGTKVAFSTYRWGDRKSRLYYAWTDEQNRRAWEWGDGGIFGEDPQWLADNRIVYRLTREDIAQDELWSMQGDDGLDRQRLFVADTIGNFSVSPDGRRAVFMVKDDQGWNLYLADIITGRHQRLTGGSANDGLPAWSPDGRHIAFSSDRSGKWALWMMAADGSEQRLVTALPGPVDGRVEFEPDYLNKGWLEEQIAWSR